MREDTKRQVLDAVAKWRPRLRLMDWSIVVRFDRKDLDEDFRMGIPMQYPYRRAFLDLAIDAGTTENTFSLEKGVLHELCHIICEPQMDAVNKALNDFKPAYDVNRLTQTWVRDANEFTTEWVARLLWEAYEQTPWDSAASEAALAVPETKGA